MPEFRMASDEPDERRGLVPPDGIAWPPEPSPSPQPASIGELPAPSLGHRREPGIGDWRQMTVDAPDGYRGSISAPQQPAARLDAWAVVASVLAVVGTVPLTWNVPLAPPLAVAFGLAGRRNCSLDPSRRGAGLATAGVLLGAATMAVVAVAVLNGRVSLGL